MKALTVLIGLFALLITIPAQAVIFGVDFNQTGNIHNQTGFSDFDRPSSGVSLPSSQTYATPEGNLTVSLTSNEQGDFFRGGFTNSGAFTYADLINDFAYSNLSPTLGFELSGPALLPNTAYTITVWGVDHAISPSTETITATGTTTGTSGTIAYTGATPTSNTDPGISTTVVFTSDPTTGKIDFSANLTSGPRVNGFQIDLVQTPEPASAGLLMFSATALLARRRRAA